MSSYFRKGKGWIYDFILKGTRFTAAGFKTKTEARQAEAKRKEEINNPKKETLIPTDMDFLELVNKRLDYIKAYNSERHYWDHVYLGRRWLRQWKDLKCSEISSTMIETYLIRRARKASAYTANKDLKSLRAMFNFGMNPPRKWLFENPTKGIKFMPVEKRIKYVPPKEDILRVIMAADLDTKDYLWTIALTMGRISEINRITWQDVNLDERYVVLYTRKKSGGHLTPRKIPMTDKLHQVLSRRFAARDKSKSWVFWHRYWDAKKGGWSEGPFKDRKRIMKTLCKNAKVRYFRFHAFRHFGASLLDRSHAPIGAIQRILGHENRTTTEIYLHSIGEAERDAMRIFDYEIEENPQTNPQTKTRKDLTLLS